MKPSEVLERLEAMGIKARLMKGGRCVLGSMRLGPQPFETLEGQVRIANVVFATVGPDRIKCLRPRALFQLPMLRIIDCRDAMSIEARIRVAWQSNLSKMRETATWLDKVGVEADCDQQQSILTFPISGEDAAVRATAIEPRRVILPGRGPLSGVALSRPEDRVMAIDAAIQSGVEVEIALSNRMAELRQIDQRMRDERRHAAILAAPPDLSTDTAVPKRSKGHQSRLLLVGPSLSQERACIESLRLRGYEVATARTQVAALSLFEQISPELVMVDVQLGRSEGIELIPAMRRVSGIEEIPVVLVDAHRRAARREAAQRVGAAGYLVSPIDVPRIAKRLERMIMTPTRRRFSRYDRRVPVRAPDRRESWLATTIGRGGMFLVTDEDLPNHSVHFCELSLPELGRTLEVEGEVLYRTSASGDSSRGFGVRFQRFHNGSEPLLIRYLATLEQTPKS
ncbi:MAG: response regulator [Myxococcota bacterium]